MICKTKCLEVGVTVKLCYLKQLSISKKFNNNTATDSWKVWKFKAGVYSKTGFARVLENLQSPEILLWHSPNSTGKSYKNGYRSWKVLEICYPFSWLNSSRNIKFIADSAENYHWDLGSERFNVSFRVLEISMCPGKVLKICFSKRAQTLRKIKCSVVSRDSASILFLGQ